jgi:inositol 1,4,5-triphosphate receptor type 3
MSINIALGTIIDKFAALRDQKKAIDDDIQNVCQICSLNREVFEKYTKGFVHHVTEVHNPWYYVYYLYGLRKKDSTEYDSMESYVANMQEDESTDWFPI